ncbi:MULTISPECIES: hypothetical protein [unclassified Cetobacterium]|uniref:hypothetical protein n=1 Tax=unclassified Cetobacterium TaxID=2630983 RepID=UPI0006469470|nr:MULTISPECIES: hypothetical protein [unclassified Cetobacterium]
MKKKIFLFLLLSIISIFGGIREEAKNKANLYTFVSSEIKELKNEKKDKYIVLDISKKNVEFLNNSNRNKKDEDIDENDTQIYLINSNFTPILRVSLIDEELSKRYSYKSLTYTILNRDQNRVLRI